MQKTKLLDLLNPRNLRRLAGTSYYLRGEDYYESGLVHDLMEYDGSIRARVKGNSDYRVKFWPENGDVGYSCSCPLGNDGTFCKHNVATGLAWWWSKTEGKSATTPLKSEDFLKQIENHLNKQDKNDLVKIIMTQVTEDMVLRNSLLMKASRSASSGRFNKAAFIAAIDKAVEPGEYVDYHHMYEYSKKIQDAIASLEELIEEGHAEPGVELAEYFLNVVDGALHSVDDSDGFMGGIKNSLEEIHLRACQLARPNPEKLAERLFDIGINSDFEVFINAAETHQEVLGEKGLIAYRKLAEEVWKEVPPVGPGDKNEAWSSHFRITHIMELLAKLSGRFENLVAVYERDLSSEYNHLRIATLYKENNQIEKALKWAERGLKSLPDNSCSRLREFLAEEYLKLGRYNEVLPTVWVEFQASPYLERYQNLKEYAYRVDKASKKKLSTLSVWPEWREKALAFIRDRIKQESREHNNVWGRTADNSTLVKIFLWEKDIDAAWAEAKKGGCHTDIWLELAEQRAKSHPEDSLKIYQSQIDPTVDLKHNEAYAQAAFVLKKIKAILIGLDRKDDFQRYLDSVRVTHKAKRNFIKEIANL